MRIALFVMGYCVNTTAAVVINCHKGFLHPTGRVCNPILGTTNSNMFY